MTTNKPTRKQALALITAEVAEAGFAGRTATRMYVESAISMEAYREAVAAGRRQYEARTGVTT